jgi:hypothetical protein
MAFSLTAYINSPEYIPGSFDNCLSCNYFRSWECSGPNIANMESKRRAVFCKAVRGLRGFTNPYIAEESGVALVTVERFFQGADLNMNSFTHISRVLFGTSNKNPCVLTIEDGTKTLLDKLTESEKENVILKETLAHINESHEKELSAVRSDLKEEILRQQKIIDKLL